MVELGSGKHSVWEYKLVAKYLRFDILLSVFCVHLLQFFLGLVNLQRRLRRYVERHVGLSRCFFLLSNGVKDTIFIARVFQLSCKSTRSCTPLESWRVSRNAYEAYVI